MDTLEYVVNGPHKLNLAEQELLEALEGLVSATLNRVGAHFLVAYEGAVRLLGEASLVVLSAMMTCWVIEAVSDPALERLLDGCSCADWFREGSSDEDLFEGHNVLAGNAFDQA